MTAKPENTRAIRTRAVVEVGEDYQMLSRDPTLYRDNISLIHFVTQQIDDADGNPINDEIDDGPSERSGQEYERLFAIRIDDLLSWAMAHGFPDTLSPEQRNAIREHVHVDLSRED